MHIWQWRGGPERQFLGPVPVSLHDGGRTGCCCPLHSKTCLLAHSFPEVLLPHLLVLLDLRPSPRHSHLLLHW